MILWPHRNSPAPARPRHRDPRRLLAPTLLAASVLGTSLMAACGGGDPEVVDGGVDGSGGSAGEAVSGTGANGSGGRTIVGFAGSGTGQAGAGGGELDYVPACGDGRLNDGEACDDGNTESSDGCTGTCKQLEADFACPTPGEPCISTVVCGDGRVTGSETCDDGNDAPGDGCGATCAQEDGWECPVVGLACQAAVCGDGILAGAEECEYADGEAPADGGGCSATCRIETGYDCDAAALTCALTVCGNGVVERGEQCDDSNDVPFDGCFECLREPSCSGGTCVSACGDGQRFDDEGCDDGNARDGDGCSSTCQEETGFTCTDVVGNPPDSIDLPVIIRDFVGNDRQLDGFTPHPDFNRHQEPQTPNIAASTLDADGKPAWNWIPYPETLDSANPPTALPANSGCSCADPSDPLSATPPACTCDDGVTVCQCNNPGALAVDNSPFNGRVMSTPANFAQWYRDVNGVNLTIPQTITLQRQGDGSYLYASADTSQDGIAHFDLLGPTGGWIAEGKESSTCNPARNVSFTTETHFWFEYQGGEQFDFRGDDDTWIFVDGKLAVDLGSLHDAEDGSFELDADTDGAGPDTADGTATVTDFVGSGRTVDLGLTPGGIYEVVMFQAERNECGSNFTITLRDFNRPRSECESTCGDGVVASDEVCDDGTNDGSYGGCQPGCLERGPYCGDGTKDDAEACDDGVNLSRYGGCAPGCVAGPECGDGEVQSAFEQCDDGTNDGSYDGCTSTCNLGPRCGDGTLQDAEGERCDDGNTNASDGCSPDCQPEEIF